MLFCVVFHLEHGGTGVDVLGTFLGDLGCAAVDSAHWLVGFLCLGLTALLSVGASSASVSMGFE